MWLAQFYSIFFNSLFVFFSVHNHLSNRSVGGCDETGPDHSPRATASGTHETENVSSTLAFHPRRFAAAIYLWQPSTIQQSHSNKYLNWMAWFVSLELDLVDVYDLYIIYIMYMQTGEFIIRSRPPIQMPRISLENKLYRSVIRVYAGLRQSSGQSWRDHRAAERCLRLTPTIEM